MSQCQEELYIGLSAGIDSVVMLDMLVKSKEHKIIAVHINHGIQSNSNEMQSHCQELCKKYDIELITKTLTGLKKVTSNLEKIYRDARYDAFVSLLPAGACIALAHHANDQFETRIKRIMTAATDISGIKASSNYKGIKIIRPILNISKQEIIKYARKNNLNWIEDKSNNDLNFERNFIRHKLAPVLLEQWSGIFKAIDTFSKKQSHLLLIANEIAESDLSLVSEGRNIYIEKLLKLSDARKINCWQKYLEGHGLYLEHRTIKSLLTQAMNGQYFSVKGLEWRCYKNVGYISTPKMKLEPIYTLDEAKEIFNLKSLNYGNLRPATPEEKITIRFRMPGQSIKVHKKQHKQKIKKLMQEWGIPVYLRDNWPIIYYNDQCACIPDYAICSGFYQASGISFSLC